VILKIVKTTEDIETFSKYKLECIKYHQEFANKLGLHDLVVENYKLEDTIKYLGKKDYYQYLIECDNKYVGMIECCKMESKIDQAKYIELLNIYIDEKYRDKQIARNAINNLKERFSLRIELDCWYNLPANHLYKSMGMKETKVRYMYDE